MTKMLKFILLVFAFIFATACTKSNPLEGEKFRFKDLEVLSLFSSSTEDYFKEQHKDYTYIISKESFTISNNEEIIIEINTPKYIKEEIEVPEEGITTPKYTICDENNKKTNYRVYEYNDKIFLDEYVEDNNTDKDMIMYTIELYKIN